MEKEKKIIFWRFFIFYVKIVSKLSLNCLLIIVLKIHVNKTL